MKSKKRLVSSLAVAVLALGGLWFWYFYASVCCAPPVPCGGGHPPIREHPAAATFGTIDRADR